MSEKKFKEICVVLGCILFIIYYTKKYKFLVEERRELEKSVNEKKE